MSWWDTANITNLASQALKNAQKKIDKVLEIKEEGGGATKDAAPKQNEEGAKSDAWAPWLGGSPDNTESDASASGWSFSWGGSTDEPGGTGALAADDTKEKTPEEIKSEVLKAAKERTRAKAKLFPGGKSKKGLETDTQQLVAVDKQTGEEQVTEEKTESVTNVSTDFPGQSSDVEKVQLQSKTGIESSMGLQEAESQSNATSGRESQDDGNTVDDAGKSGVAQLDTSSATESDGEAVAGAKALQLDRGMAETPDQSLETVSVLGPSSSSVIEESEAGVFQELSVQVEDHYALKPRHDDDVKLQAVSASDLLSVGLEASSEATLDSCSSPLEDTSDKTDSYSTCIGEPLMKSSVVSSEAFITTDGSGNEEKMVLEKSADWSSSENPGLDVHTQTVCEISATDVSSSLEIIRTEDVPSLDADETELSASSVAISMSVDTDGQAPTEEGSSQVPPAQDEAQSVIPVTGESVQSDDPALAPELEEDSGKDGCDSDTGPLLTAGPGDEPVTLATDDLQGKPEVTEKGRSAPPSSGSESSLCSTYKLDTSLDTYTSEETLMDSSDSGAGGTRPGSSAEEKVVTADDKVEPVIDQQEGDMPETVENVQEEKEDGQGEGECSESEGSKPSGEGEDTEMTDDTKPASDQGSENEDKAELSPANSFVKCMLEDAMEDGKHDSDSHSGAEKSEGSSRSVHSGHDSSDEIDTTTSSDIEIISLPTPNGENRQVSPVDPIPLRIALQKQSWKSSPSHRRTDSQSSSSTNSKDGAGEQQLSPGRDSVEYAEWRLAQEHAEDSRNRMMELPALDEEDDNPYHPQRLLKEASDMEHSHDPESHDPGSHDLQNTSFEQKMAEMAEILEAREAKLLQLSKDNCDLMETNSILKTQLKQAEEVREAEMTDLDELTAEFTQRLTDAEKRISTILKEKETVRKQLLAAQTEIAKKAADTSMQQILAEKEEQIKELLQEGEKLSKGQLQGNTIIKKLRAREKDTESTISSQKKSLESQKEELDHLHKVLESKEELEKTQKEAIAQLNEAVQKQEKELMRLKSDHEDSQEKARGLQVALDNSYKEMAELHRNNAVQDSKAQEAALSTEMQVREELKMAIEKQDQQHKWEKESLIMQIEDLRLTMLRMEKEHNRREDMLRQEISDLQKQLQEDEARNQELTHSVTSATRPLLRQIENLQSTYAAQSGIWEKVEKNLTDRLADTQNQLAVALEKERTMSEQMLEMGTKVTGLETQTTHLKQDKSHLSAQLDVLRNKMEQTEDAKQTEAAQLEVLKVQMAQEVSDLKKDKVLLETQLDMEKSKVEQERKMVNLAQEQIKDMEREMQRARSRGPPSRGSPSPVSISRQDSIASSMHEQPFTAITQEELDRSFILTSANGSKQSLYEALRQSGAANLLENLQSKLKQREGEIQHLQGEIRSLEQTREAMARELVDLANRNDDLQTQVTELPEIQQQCTELGQRYNALLQMYGEKVEETNELRLDLHDVKEMYKSQINHLLAK